MQRYTVQRQLGDGAYGRVVCAKDNETGELVAIKGIKKRIERWNEALGLREVKALTTIKKHPNIVRLKQLIHENQMVYFVFEYCESNLLEVQRKFGRLPEPVIRNIAKQILQGLSHMHKHGFFHRDIKPENLLVRDCPSEEAYNAATDKAAVFRDMQIKIADFGLAREIRSRPPYTDYVATRWYRAPELLLRSGPGQYSSAVDLWAVGCILGELYAGKPLAAGATEANQFFKLCILLGSPTSQEWQQGIRLIHNSGLVLPSQSDSEESLEHMCADAPSEAVALVRLLLNWNPTRRPNAAAALKHAYFRSTAAQDLSSRGGSGRSSNSRSHSGRALQHSHSFSTSSENSKAKQGWYKKDYKSFDSSTSESRALNSSQISMSTSVLPEHNTHKHEDTENRPSTINSPLPHEVDSVMAEAFELIEADGNRATKSSATSASYTSSFNRLTASTVQNPEHQPVSYSTYSSETTSATTTGVGTSSSYAATATSSYSAAPASTTSNQFPKAPLSPTNGLQADASLDASAFMELLNELEQEKCQ
eukprot:gb/GECG01011180.1/.p1 GENE.gb/GECG01011180.1/~~gb/GECG01011180.1/.p1  ORF type:complete len:536 (+),score=60.75 gb/GECG01011180.1/:1-1608(+)